MIPLHFPINCFRRRIFKQGTDIGCISAGISAGRLRFHGVSDTLAVGDFRSKIDWGRQDPQCGWEFWEEVTSSGQGMPGGCAEQGQG